MSYISMETDKVCMLKDVLLSKNQCRIFRLFLSQVRKTLINYFFL